MTVQLVAIVLTLTVELFNNIAIAEEYPEIHTYFHYGYSDYDRYVLSKQNVITFFFSFVYLFDEKKNKRQKTIGCRSFFRNTWCMCGVICCAPKSCTFGESNRYTWVKQNCKQSLLLIG